MPASIPTTAKPAVAVLNTAATLGANCLAKIPVTEALAYALPAEVVRGTLPVLATGSGSGGLGLGGPPPSINPTGLVIGGVTIGPTMEFRRGQKGLFYPLSGITAVHNGPKTIACIIKPTISCYNHTYGGGLGYSLITLGWQGPCGISLGTITDNAANSSERMQLNGFSNGYNIGPAALIEIAMGRTYAIALAWGTGGTVKTYYVRDLTNGNNHPLSGMTESDTATGPVYSNGIGVCCYGIAANNQYTGSIGDIHLDSTAWTATDFNNYCTDPFSMIRGTYTASGALTVPDGRVLDSSSTTVWVGWPRPKGIGTGGGTGSPALTVWRCDPKLVTAGSTTIPGSAVQVSSALVDTTQGPVYVHDSAVTPNQTAAYYLKAVDGTQTLTSLPAIGRARSKVDMFVGYMGDSLAVLPGSVEMIATAGQADNRRMQLICHAKAGTALGALNSGSCFDPPSITPAGSQGMDLSYGNGTPTGGTFDLSFGYATPIVITGIAYNVTPAAMQTALVAALGAGYTCVGNSLNVGNLTIVGPVGTTYPIPTMVLSTSTLAGAPTTSGVPLVVTSRMGNTYAPGNTATNLYNLWKAELIASGLPAGSPVIIALGVNDTAGAPWQAALERVIVDVLAQGWVPLCDYPVTRHGTQYTQDAGSESTFVAFQPYVDAAIAAHAGAKLGDTQNYYDSIIRLTTEGDTVHPSAGSAMAASVGLNNYRAAAAVIDGITGATTIASKTRQLRRFR